MELNLMFEMRFLFSWMVSSSLLCNSCTDSSNSFELTFDSLVLLALVLVLVLV